ncbi:MAG: GTP-binding protein, partial [Candidatus Nomurabacteria bacterium]|nr:GTP-binding protein [Candidatus Nomurabacteria bacterium]
MRKKLPIVAIVGQTNAGKSALFNRIVGRQDAIVAREPGTTRDSVVRATDDFILVDTAGLKDPVDDFEATIQEQIDDAVDSADLILVVKDRTEMPTDDDRRIAKKALRSKKPVILVLNKTDLREQLPREEFLRLGIRDIVETSAEHNQGIKSLVNEIKKSVDPDRAVWAAAPEGVPRTMFSRSEKFSGEEVLTGPKHPEDET